MLARYPSQHCVTLHFYARYLTSGQRIFLGFLEHGRNATNTGPSACSASISSDRRQHDRMAQ